MEFSFKNYVMTRKAESSMPILVKSIVEIELNFMNLRAGLSSSTFLFCKARKGVLSSLDKLKPGMISFSITLLSKSSSYNNGGGILPKIFYMKILFERAGSKYFFMLFFLILMPVISKERRYLLSFRHSAKCFRPGSSVIS